MTINAPSQSYSLPPEFRTAGRLLGLTGLIGLGVCIVVWIVSMSFGARWPQMAGAFYRAYLFAWIMFLGISLGSMSAVMVHHLTGGEWGYFIRRFGEAATSTLPLLFILFVPVLMGLQHLYPWADPRNHSVAVAHKHGYLNPGFFFIRYVVYFAIWIVMAWFLRTLSLKHDRDHSARTASALHTLSAVGLLVYFVTMSLAAIDWIMSMDPEWYSTVFGFIVCMGQAVGGLSVLIIMLHLTSEVSPIAGRLESRHMNDLASLLVTAIVLWAYNSFSQLLIIWMGNIQHEVNWYVQRTNGSWRLMSMVLCFIGFLAPFVLLLQRGVKRRGRAMLWVCIGLLAMRLLDNYWMIAPGGVEPFPSLSWLNVLLSVISLIGIGGVWIATFLWLVDRAPLMPAPDGESAESGHGGPVPGIIGPTTA